MWDGIIVLSRTTPLEPGQMRSQGRAWTDVERVDSKLGIIHLSAEKAN
jgi:hypothetical protein